MSSISTLMEEVRLERGFSPSRMAKELGISRQHYHALVKGQVHLSIAKAAIYGELLGQQQRFVETIIRNKLKQYNLNYIVSLRPSVQDGASL